MNNLVYLAFKPKRHLHQIEPYYHWRHLYIANEDEQSPFFGRTYSEFEFTNRIYNYLIHPQWDEFGSPTLFMKILFVDYSNNQAIIELIGEWNDCIQDDIMTLKNNVIDHLQYNGISKFIVICENVLNFHGGDDDYYEELREEIVENNGWLVFVNLLPHVEQEMISHGIQNYVTLGYPFHDLSWRKYKPDQLGKLMDKLILAPYLATRNES